MKTSASDRRIAAALPAALTHVTNTTEQLADATLALAAYSRIDVDTVIAKLAQIENTLRTVGSPTAIVLADIIAKQVGGVRFVKNSNRMHLTSLLIWAGSIEMGMI